MSVRAPQVPCLDNNLRIDEIKINYIIAHLTMYGIMEMDSDSGFLIKQFGEWTVYLQSRRISGAPKNHLIFFTYSKNHL